jgi:hypothetical protein
MKRFECPDCAAEVYFENSLCLTCGHPIFFDPAAGTFRLGQTPCANREIIGCNWTADEAGRLCPSCARTEVIPDLSVEGNALRWRKIETAKRRLLYSLGGLGLPTESGAGRRLRFRFLANGAGDAATGPVLTGHDNGVLTLNVAEADDDAREATRLAMGEPYRTLLGHFRHESGHFFWDVLVQDGNRIEDFRDLFGDEREDYEQALARHYSKGSGDWEARHVSAYASAHPWEDFAETWAHGLHMLDAIETARAYGLAPSRTADDDRDAESLIANWLPLSLAMNAMNRSLGHGDFYPFHFAGPVREKLAFVLGLLRPKAPSA